MQCVNMLDKKLYNKMAKQCVNMLDKKLYNKMVKMTIFVCFNIILKGEADLFTFLSKNV